jgi:hypothetical protein
MQLLIEQRTGLALDVFKPVPDDIGNMMLAASDIDLALNIYFEWYKTVAESESEYERVVADMTNEFLADPKLWLVCEQNDDYIDIPLPRTNPAGSSRLRSKL